MAMASKTSPLPTCNVLRQRVDLVGRWHGQFQRSHKLQLLAIEPWSVAVGDFNGDGKQDLAVANFNSGNVSILLGDGTGNFSAPTNFNAGDEPWFSSGGRFQWRRQARPRRCQRRSDNVSILLGDGTGNFSGSHKLQRWRLSSLSGGGRFQWRWQARPRRCSTNLRQRVDLVTRLPGGESNHSRGDDLQPVLVRHR